MTILAAGGIDVNLDRAEMARLIEARREGATRAGLAGATFPEMEQAGEAAELRALAAILTGRAAAIKGRAEERHEEFPRRVRTRIEAVPPSVRCREERHEFVAGQDTDDPRGGLLAGHEA